MAKDILKRYSETFKHQVVREYEAGASVHSLQQKYGITGSPTIKNWINKYSYEGYRCETTVIQTAADQLEFKTLKAHISELESALAETVLENRMLHTTLDVAAEALNLDLKKSFGRKS